MYVQRLAKVFRHLLRKIFMAILRALYETVWNFLGIATRHDYRRRGGINDSKPIRKYVEKLSDVSRKRTLTRIYDKHTQKLGIRYTRYTARLVALNVQLVLKKTWSYRISRFLDVTNNYEYFGNLCEGYARNRYLVASIVYTVRDWFQILSM